MKKNDVLTLTCSDIGSDMEGICHTDQQTVFVPGMLAGESGSVRIERVTSSVAFGKLLRLGGASSPERCNPQCASYPKCGGCTCRHMTYEATLRCKQNQVRNVLHKIAHIGIDIPPVIGMENPHNYRNKTTLPVGGTAAAPEAGFFAPRTHRLIPADNCPNSMSPTGEICHGFLEWMKKFAIAPYSEEHGSGLIRHIVVRVNQAHQAMVTIVINGKSLPHTDELCAELSRLGAVSIFINQNTDRTNVIFGKNFRKIYGADTLTDTLCGFAFQLSPASFFQVNPVQTQRLYQTAIDFANLSPSDTAVDLYCGAGTISLLLSKKARRVIGIEVVPEAIDNAVKNAADNGICNAEFILGTAEEKLPQLAAQGVPMDVVVVDPPRKGLDKDVIDTLCTVKPRRIVYVSCNVSTQARDIALFALGGYNLKKVQSVDMFCYTSGIENVALLEQR